jgi:hypothetical protein
MVLAGCGVLLNLSIDSYAVKNSYDISVTDEEWMSFVYFTDLVPYFYDKRNKSLICSLPGKIRVTDGLVGGVETAYMAIESGRYGPKCKKQRHKYRMLVAWLKEAIQVYKEAPGTAIKIYTT